MELSSRAPGDGLAESQECQCQNEECDGKQADQFTAFAHALPLLQLKFAFLILILKSAVFAQSVVISHTTILRVDVPPLKGLGLAGYVFPPLPRWTNQFRLCEARPMLIAGSHRINDLDLYQGTTLVVPNEAR